MKKLEKIGQFGHQGDVFFTKVEDKPKQAKEVKNDDTKKNIVLAHGEVTGHKHQIIEESPNIKLFEIMTNDGLERYLEVMEDQATLVHEEHSPFVFNKGIYKIDIHREYSPEEIRRVED